MKKLFVLFIAVFITATAFGQWNVNGTDLTTSQNVKIGGSLNNNKLKLTIPGLHNFEQIRLGQYGNGAGGLEFTNHVGLDTSYGVRLFVNVDNKINGLQIQTANQQNSFEKLEYVTRMAINTNGNVGIGTLNPRALFDVGGYKLGNNFENELKSVLARLNEGNTIGEGTYLGVKSYVSQKTTEFPEGNVRSFALEHKFFGKLNSAINFYRGGSEIGGHIGISVNDGTEVCKFKRGVVEVKGILRAQEVKVEAENWAWPDFVFSSDYNLRKLSDVEAHINEHKHLPDMPSEAQVKEEGVNLAEMQAKLLQKIEELTLYVIEQDKEIKNQNKMLELQSRKIEILEQQLQKNN